MSQKTATPVHSRRSQDVCHVVAHLVFPYLFGTGSWIYGQLMHMRRYRPIVLTGHIENLDIFPFKPIYAYENVSTPRKALLCIWKRRLRGAADAYFEWMLRREASSLIHCHFGDCGAEMLVVKKASGLPMITTFYGADASQGPRDPAWWLRYEALFKEGDLFLAEGEAMRRSLLDLGCPHEKVVVQHLGVDLETLQFSPRVPDPSGTVEILIAGIFREKKGIPDALRAVERVSKRYPQIRVTLIGDSAGKPGDAEEKSIILSLLGRLNGVARWLGFVPYPLFRQALLVHHLFLSPSVTARDGDSEGGAPVSLIEAQATGMPVVSTFHADIPEVVVNGKTGLLSPERDLDALTENLERLVTEPLLWAEMGEAGRTHVEMNYDVRKQVRLLEEIYSRLLPSPA